MWRLWGLVQCLLILARLGGEKEEYEDVRPKCWSGGSPPPPPAGIKERNKSSFQENHYQRTFLEETRVTVSAEQVAEGREIL